MTLSCALRNADRQLATEVLADWYGEPVTVSLVERVVRRADDRTSVPTVFLPARSWMRDAQARLAAPAAARLLHRLVRISTPRQGMIGRAYAAVALDRITPAERHMLTETDVSLGRSLRPNGVRRSVLNVRQARSSGDEVVTVRAILRRGPVPLAYVAEEFDDTSPG